MLLHLLASVQKMSDKEKPKKVIVVISCLFFVAIGTWAIMQPDLLSDYDPIGRKAFFKSILKWAWGSTGGIIAVVFGVLAMIGAFIPHADADADAESDADGYDEEYEDFE